MQIYLELLAFQLGFNLGEITASKFNEVSERINVFIRIRAGRAEQFIPHAHETCEPPNCSGTWTKM